MTDEEQHCYVVFVEFRTQQRLQIRHRWSRLSYRLTDAIFRPLPTDSIGQAIREEEQFASGRNDDALALKGSFGNEP
jgi:hypothetical protein